MPFASPPAPPPPWLEVAPGGATTCARGAPFAFFVHPGDPAKVIVDFAGGGACGDAATCDTKDPTFIDSVDSVREELQKEPGQGVYALTDARNPFRGWTHIVVPYCTGDLHWGAADVRYTRPDHSSFVIHHQGAANATAAIDWTAQHYPAPGRMLVSGCSAGAYGSIYWTPRLRQLYPQAVMQQFGDSGAGIVIPDVAHQPGSIGVPVWNIAANAPAWVPGLDPAKVDFAHLTLNQIYTRTANYLPQLQFAEFNHAFDAVQMYFFADTAAAQAAWSPLMFSAVHELESLPNFHAYTAAGSDHCIMTSPDVYTLQTQNTSFQTWLTDYLNLGPYSNVECSSGQCGSPAPEITGG